MSKVASLTATKHTPDKTQLCFQTELLPAVKIRTLMTAYLQNLF